MSLLSRLEHALEALAEGSAEQIFGGRLDLVAVGQELYNAAVERSRATDEGPEAPALYRVYLALGDHGELGDDLERLEREYSRSLWKRLRQAGYTLRSVPRVLMTPSDALEPGRFGVEAGFRTEGPSCLLTVLGPTRATHRVELPAVIGREPGCSLRLDSSSVSRRHAEVRWDRNRFLLSDLGSKNGTLRNGVAVTSSPLEPGDVIVVGGERLRLSVDPGPESDPPTNAPQR